MFRYTQGGKRHGEGGVADKERWWIRKTHTHTEGVVLDTLWLNGECRVRQWEGITDVSNLAA